MRRLNCFIVLDNSGSGCYLNMLLVGHCCRHLEGLTRRIGEVSSTTSPWLNQQITQSLVGVTYMPDEVVIISRWCRKTSGA